MKRKDSIVLDDFLMAVYFVGSPSDWLRKIPVERKLVRKGYDMSKIRKEIAQQVMEKYSTSPEYRLTPEEIKKALRDLKARKAELTTLPPPGKL